MSEHSELLKHLQLGEDKTTIPVQNADASSQQYDEEKVKRGQIFFQKHNTNCIMAMLCSLVSGLSVEALLDSLVFTGQSNTPTKSLKRYLLTLQHLMKWHYGNIFDEKSDARASLVYVHNLHDEVREKMSKERNDNRTYLSQYHMSLVQSGFIGVIIMYPAFFGIKCSEDDLDDYVYLWRYLGDLLGISEHNNICSKGYSSAYKVCKDIEEHIVCPSLQNPSKEFYPMAKAFTDGLNKLTVLPLFSPECLINMVMDAMNRRRLYKMTVLDFARLYFFRGLFFLLKHTSLIKRLLNRRNEVLCGLRR